MKPQTVKRSMKLLDVIDSEVYWLIDLLRSLDENCEIEILTDNNEMLKFIWMACTHTVGKFAFVKDPSGETNDYGWMLIGEV